MNLNLILIFCAGYTFAVGGLNLLIGISYKKDRSYLYFGLLSLFASLFLLIQISAIDLVYGDVADYVGITLACTFYGLFLWFICEYTQYLKRNFRWGILLFIALTYIGYFFAKASIIPWSAWEFHAHLTILFIGIYGIVAGYRSANNNYGVWRHVFISLMLLLSVTAVYYGLSSVINHHLDFMLQGNVTLLDFFPVFFSILIGSKLSHEILRSAKLEDEVLHKDREWSELLDAINLAVIKLDLEGKVLYANAHFLRFTGYDARELLGKNFFEVGIAANENSEFKQSLMQPKAEGNIPFFHSQIKTSDGKLVSIQWSNLALRDTEDNKVGTLSIGADITERESAFAEIKMLKDQLEKENLLLKEEAKGNVLSSEIIGKSDALMYVIKRAQQVAGTDSSVLLEGETGVGKELFANMIHNNSMRKHKPLIKVNCASLPKELIESELFGHEKGSFTGAVKTRQGRFELADKGTIFLDEIGELPRDLQPKLLRVLQSGDFERIGSEHTKKVDVRVIAATNRNLQEESEKGLFRQDLFFRLNVYPITIPPLRQRIEDIPVLMRHFTSKISRKIGRKISHISKADIKRLQRYDWPGNVRELENVLERAIINSEGDTISLDESQLKPTFVSPKNDATSDHVPTSLIESQKMHIIKVLNECDWKINGEHGAAVKLGMPPSTLRSKMKKLEIERPEAGKPTIK